MSLQITTPAQRLTSDLLWYLFGHVCISDPFNGPMSASQVCQRWRLVALESPLLWSNITIRLYTVTSGASAQKHKLALAYFQRSGNLPITVTIHATRQFQSWEKKDLLLPHAHRFHSLHVKASAGSLINYLWKDMNMPMPRLEAFYTSITNTSHITLTRKINTIDENVSIIPPVDDYNSVRWSSWTPTALTTLCLDITRLRNRPDLGDIYHALGTMCHTIQNLEYRGLVSLINNAGANTRTHLFFPALRSLAVFSPDNVVPLLEFMMIQDLESLTIRDFLLYPTSSDTTATELMDTPELFNVTFDPDGLFQAIKRWTTISHLEIFGIDDESETSNFLSPPPNLLNYIQSLNQLSSLVLYGDGTATSIANTLFMHDATKEFLLPQLSYFILAINKMSPNHDLCDYLMARQRHRFPPLQKLSINLDYVQHISDLNRMPILRDGSDAIFVFENPEAGKYIPIKEVPVDFDEW